MSAGYGPNPGAVQAFNQFERNTSYQPWQRPPRSGYTPGDDKYTASQANNFPASYYNKNPYDDFYSAKQQALASEMYKPSDGVKLNAEITDADVQYLQQKQADMGYANFLVWAEQEFDLTDPANARLFAEIMPDYFAKRENLIDQTLAIQGQYAKLRLHGPRSMEDLVFMWGIQTGRIPLVKGPVWDPQEWEDQGPEKKLALFNPFRMTDATNAPRIASPLNRMDAANPAGPWMSLGVPGRDGFMNSSGMMEYAPNNTLFNVKNVGNSMRAPTNATAFVNQRGSVYGK